MTRAQERAELRLSHKAERLAALWIARRAFGVKPMPRDVFAGWKAAAQDTDPPLPLSLTAPDPVMWHAGWLVFQHEHGHDLDEGADR